MMHPIVETLAAASDTESFSFWGAVGLAAAIATALATAASTIVSIWWRYQDRQEAEFIFHFEDRGGTTSRGATAASPQVSFRVQNIGDGAAHKVMIEGTQLVRKPFIGATERGQYGSRREQSLPIPVMRTGDAVYVHAHAESFDVWGSAYVEVSWWPPPTRKQKHWIFISRQQSKRFLLSDITPVPSDLDPETEDDPVY